MADARLTQDVIEALSQPVPGVRISQDAIELLSLNVEATTAAILTQYTAEVLSQAPVAARLTQLLIETLSKNPLYTCATAEAGPSICGTEPVLTWIEQTYTRVGSPTSDARVVSDAPLNDPSGYYGGPKAPRVLGFGGITRALSDVQGQWTAATMRWREAEIDRIVRRRFADPAAYPVVNAVDVCRMIRESDWRDQGEARLMFMGHRLQAQPAEDLSIEQESGDLLARDLENAGQEARIAPAALLGELHAGHSPGAAGRPRTDHLRARLGRPLDRDAAVDVGLDESRRLHDRPLCRFRLGADAV